MRFDDGGVIEIADGSGKVSYVPTYTCAHCTQVILMRPERTRERVRCTRCLRLICEKSELCRSQCTPLHEIAQDHFENAGEFGRLVPAIMQGITTIDEAQKKGLIF